MLNVLPFKEPPYYHPNRIFSIFQKFGLSNPNTLLRSLILKLTWLKDEEKGLNQCQRKSLISLKFFLNQVILMIYEDMLLFSCWQNPSSCWQNPSSMLSLAGQHWAIFLKSFYFSYQIKLCFILVPKKTCQCLQTVKHIFWYIVL